MKRILACLLILALLLALCACGDAPDSESAPGSAPEPTPEPMPEKTYTADEAREALDAWLERDCSFNMLFRLLSLPGQYGIEIKIEQSCGADGSSVFDLFAQWWDQLSDWEEQKRALYYYAEEDGKLVCTVQFNNDPVERYTLTARERQERELSRQQMTGVDTLLPAWAEDFRQEPAEGDPELICFRYSLPVERVMLEENMLNTALTNVLWFQGMDAFPEGLRVGAAFYVEKETLRPRSLVYDFSELTPCVFEDWEHLPDAAEDTARMEMSFIFDFDLAETVPMPEELSSAPESAGSVDSPLAGTVGDGFYTPAGLGIRFPLEGWEVADRASMAGIVYGSRDDALTPPEELFAQGRSYGDVMLTRGYTTVFFLLTQLPITREDGTRIETLEAYMEDTERSMPQTYEEMGLELVSYERTQTEICGRSFELHRVHAAGEGIDLYLGFLATEQNGVLYTVNINCIGEDDTDEILAGFRPVE